MNIDIWEVIPLNPRDKAEIYFVAQNNLRQSDLRKRQVQIGAGKPSRSMILEISSKSLEWLISHLRKRSLLQKSASKVVTFFPARLANFLRSSMTSQHSRSGEDPTYSLDIGFGLPTSETPLVSIVIPVHNNYWMTYKCLRAIQKSLNQTPYEVIIVNDASTDLTSTALKNVRGIKVINLSNNLGYLEATRVGASMSSEYSHFLLLLNNDTEPIGNWIDELIETFRSKDNVGIVGSTLFFPDGSLQESGNQIFRNGRGWNIGRNEHGVSDMFCNDREVDYCSAASILVLKNFWIQVDGFDSRFAPAYYEDTDLAMSAWSLGYKVLVSSKSWVIHHEGVSHGTSLTHGIKRFQEINRARFVGKWHRELEKHWQESSTPRIESTRHSIGICVLVDYQFPDETRDSGSQRTINIAKILNAMGYHVVMFAVDYSTHGNQIEELRSFGIEVHLDNSEALKSLRIRSSRIKFFWLIREEVYDLFSEKLREISETAPFIGDLLDLKYNKQSLAEISQNQIRIAREADAVVLVSPVEAQLLSKTINKPVFNLWYGFDSIRTTKIESEKSGVIFVGGFRHSPNLEGIRWFGKYVFPHLKSLDFDEPVYVVGSGLGEKETRELEDYGVTVLGYVHDIETWYQRVKMAIVPLRSGAGLKGKLAEALRFNLPVVTTSVGIEGFPTETNNQLPFLICDEPDEFARTLAELCANNSYRRKIASNCEAYLSENFSTQATERSLSEILTNLKITNRNSL